MRPRACRDGLGQSRSTRQGCPGGGACARPCSLAGSRTYPQVGESGVMARAIEPRKGAKADGYDECPETAGRCPEGPGGFRAAHGKRGRTVSSPIREGRALRDVPAQETELFACAPCLGRPHAWPSRQTVLQLPQGTRIWLLSGGVLSPRKGVDQTGLGFLAMFGQGP